MADDQNDGIEDDGTQEPEASWIKDLRKKAERLPQVESQLQQFLDKETLREAGVELTPQQTKALFATHEGEKNPEALKKTATELGFYTPPPEVSPEVQQGHETVAQASNGAQPTPTPTSDDEYAAANTPEEVMAIAERRGSAVVWD